MSTSQVALSPHAFGEDEAQDPAEAYDLDDAPEEETRLHDVSFLTPYASDEEDVQEQSHASDAEEQWTAVGDSATTAVEMTAEPQESEGEPATGQGEDGDGETEAEDHNEVGENIPLGNEQMFVNNSSNAHETWSDWMSVDSRYDRDVAAQSNSGDQEARGASPPLAHIDAAAASDVTMEDAADEGSSTATPRASASPEPEPAVARPQMSSVNLSLYLTHHAHGSDAEAEIHSMGVPIDHAQLSSTSTTAQLDVYTQPNKLVNSKRFISYEHNERTVDGSRPSLLDQVGAATATSSAAHEDALSMHGDSTGSVASDDPAADATNAESFTTTPRASASSQPPAERGTARWQMSSESVDIVLRLSRQSQGSDQDAEAEIHSTGVDIDHAQLSLTPTTTQLNVYTQSNKLHNPRSLNLTGKLSTARPLTSFDARDFDRVCGR